MYGIYIHIPFCKSKCKYCDFASFPQKLSLQNAYTDALIAELEENKGICADTVYIGGGTPSVLSQYNLRRLLRAVNENISLSPDTEFTVEVNPATVDENKAKVLLEGGVNRISMGVQSFSDVELKALGRIHSSKDAEDTYRLLRDAGFDNISLDLMYALPGQTMESLSTSLERVLKLNPEHISCYGLKYEEGTPFYNDLSAGKLKECDDDTFADMFDLIRTRLTKHGYCHYEISNFAKEGRESRHNLKYWLGDDYIGIGTAAASRVGARHYTYSASVEEYINGRLLSEDYTMDLKQQMQEFIILGLRVINRGVDKAKFEKSFGLSADTEFSRAIDRVAPYVINTKTSLKLKPEAVLVSNSIMCEFME